MTWLHVASSLTAAGVDAYVTLREQASPGCAVATLRRSPRVLVEVRVYISVSHHVFSAEPCGLVLRCFTDLLYALSEPVRWST